MKHFLKLFSVFTLMLSMGFVACTEGGDEENEPGGSKPGGIYGTLGGNLITIGSTKDVTYTSCVLLGTVDFPKDYQRPHLWHRVSGGIAEPRFRLW